MSAYTFDTPSHDCPICRRAGAAKPHKLITGLLTCQHCRERLVVTWSGHYVRDPFARKQLASGQQLRRESHPFARMRRDFKLTTHPLLLAVLGGAVFFGTAFAVAQTTSLWQPSSVQDSPTAAKIDPPS